jgi:hypothetical protein
MNIRKDKFLQFYSLLKLNKEAKKGRKYQNGETRISSQLPINNRDSSINKYKNMVVSSHPRNLAG